jgi:hypothetical protein
MEGNASITGGTHADPSAHRTKVEADIQRIRQSCAGDEKVKQLLEAALTAAAPAILKHTAELQAGGKYAG